MLSNNINISILMFYKMTLPPGRPWVGLNVPREKDPGFRIRTKTRSRTLWSSRRALWPGSHLGACVLLLHLVALFCTGSQISFENQNIMLKKLLKTCSSDLLRSSLLPHRALEVLKEKDFKTWNNWPESCHIWCEKKRQLRSPALIGRAVSQGRVYFSTEK